MKEILVDKCSTIMADAVNSLLKTGEVQSTIFFGKGESLQHIDLSFPDTPFEKMKLVEKLRNHAAELRAEYVILISDCWTSKQLETQPSIDPKKRESIVMTCQYEDISFLMIQEYTRTDDNQIILGDRHMDDFNGGIFASLVPKTDKHVCAARVLLQTD